MPSSDHPDVLLRLRPFREAHRPHGCTGVEPCWVNDPYAACVAARSMVCATCGSRLKEPAPVDLAQLALDCLPA